MKKKQETDAPWELSELERRRLTQFVHDSYPQYSRLTKRLWAECRDWHLARGVQRVNWEAEIPEGMA